MTADLLPGLFQNNRDWADRRTRDDPGYFTRLAKQQSPKYLWIGCSDSRVPANEIVGLDPGELFVHRNIANVVVHTDFNCLSVLQFAIEALRVEHVMVVGHYGCSGIHQAISGGMQGVADNWLRHIEDVQRRYAQVLDGLSPRDHDDMMCELNVIEQVRNVCRTNVVRDAWRDGRPLTVHGWVYGLKDGLLKDLGLSTSEMPADIEADLTDCVQRLRAARG
ncbi:MAG TPA: carbonate dehydratase [Burkholderiaceae bacterium]|nr:carbonate dehydratase [Burkholderiaceae bacterium]